MLESAEKDQDHEAPLEGDALTVPVEMAWQYLQGRHLFSISVTETRWFRGEHGCWVLKHVETFVETCVETLVKKKNLV